LRRVQRARGGLCGGNRETKVDNRIVKKFKGLKVKGFGKSIRVQKLRGSKVYESESL
jgi:hypothetical protein